MRGRAVLLAVAAVIAATLVWRVSLGARTGVLSYYAPDAYVARANDFIARGLLEASCRDQEPRLVPHLDTASAADRAWYEESYLAADVARFNEDPQSFGWTFAIDADCRLRGVHPAVHAIELPFGHRLRWLGDILYRSEGADAVLRSAERTITLKQPTAPVPATAGETTRVGSSENVANEGLVLLHFPGGAGRPAGRVFPIGSEVVVQNRVRGVEEETRLLGHRLPVGRWARLETGDWLSFSSREPSGRVSETFVFEGGEVRELASTVRRQNDRYERRSDDPGLGQVPDPVQETSYPYLDQVAKTIDRVLTVLPSAEGEALSKSFDVQLTVERSLQLELSETFRGFCLDLKKRRDLELPFSAGVTVLDGLSGDLLALATFPVDNDLRGIDLEARQRRRLLQNQNFILHPIGSAGKPYFFAATAHAFPALLGLEIAGHAGERYHPDLFQCRIPVGYHLLDGHGDGWIDFAKALEISCNKYTMEIATLALAMEPAQVRGGGAGLERLIARDAAVVWPKPGASSEVRLGGEELGYAPDLGGFFIAGRAVNDPKHGSVVRCTNVDKLDQAAWNDPLQRVTGADTYRGVVPPVLPGEPTRKHLEQSYLSGRYDFAPWRRLVDHLSVGHEQDGVGLQVRTTLQEISPERVNLALNQVTRVRADFVSLMLGGGTSEWTNVQLAEGLGRLVTGRGLKARLAAGMVPRGDETSRAKPAPPPARRTLEAALELRPEVREKVLEGLQRVVFGEAGTAQRLRTPFQRLQAEFPDDTLALYSKTGSPIIERAVPAALGKALEQLVVRGRLRLEGGRLLVDLDTRDVPHARTGAAGRDAYLSALQQALAEVGYHRSRWVFGVMRGVVDDFAADLAAGVIGEEEHDAPLKVEAGKLVVNRESGLFARRSVQSKAGIYHFALVKLPGRERLLPPTEQDLRNPAARVIVVAIHLEAGEGSEDAVAAAVEIFPRLAPLLK